MNQQNPPEHGVVTNSPLNPRRLPPDTEWVDYVPKAQLKAAVHEAYVNAERAVAAIEVGGGTVTWVTGRGTMQAAAVRAIRTAAEEAGNG